MLSLNEYFLWISYFEKIWKKSEKKSVMTDGQTDGKQLRQTYNRACNVDSGNGWECAASRQVKTLEQVRQKKELSKSCYSHIRQLRCIRPYLDCKTASTIVASIVHSKLDYCNSLYYNLPKSQINRLQQIQHCLARTVLYARIADRTASQHTRSLGSN